MTPLTGWAPALQGGGRRFPDGSGDTPSGRLPPLGAEPPLTARQVAREIPPLLVAAVVIAFVVKTFLAQLFFIPSVSMVPELKVGDRVAVSKLAYHLHPIHRGDVIVFHAPFPRRPDHATAPTRMVRSVLRAIGVAQPSTEELIKRVIALPGETVEGRADGHVYVNGRRVLEPYLAPGIPEGRSFPPVRLGRGQLWVMGDNRANSLDSRFFGPISRSRVVGRAIWRIWPPARVAFL